MCGRQFSHRHLLEVHMKIATHTQTEPMSCMECAFQTRNFLEFKRHVQTHSFHQRSYCCPICKRMFAGRQRLREHVRRTCVRLEEVPCPTCGRKFSTLANAKAHVRTQHLKNRRFGCAYCGRWMCRMRDLLDHHERFHNEHHLLCAVCEKDLHAFTNKEQSEHIRSHSNLSKLPSFSILPKGPRTLSNKYVYKWMNSSSSHATLSPPSSSGASNRTEGFPIMVNSMIPKLIGVSRRRRPGGDDEARRNE